MVVKNDDLPWYKAIKHLKQNPRLFEWIIIFHGKHAYLETSTQDTFEQR